MKKPSITLAATALATATALKAGAALAEDAQKPATPSFTDVLASSGITVSGYVAASYSKNSGYPFNIHQFDTKQ